jgi:hypothetical protein
MASCGGYVGTRRRIRSPVLSVALRPIGRKAGRELALFERGVYHEDWQARPGGRLLHTSWSSLDLIRPRARARASGVSATDRLSSSPLA